MNFIQTTTRFMRLGLSAVVFVPFIAQAAPFEFDDADLLLAVQAVGGDGTTKNLFFNLGNTVTIKNSPNQGVVGDISDDLADAFGNDWWTRTDLFFGVFGNRSNLSTTLEPGNPPLVEPGRTIYVSIQTSAAGTASLRSQFGTSTLATGAGSYAGLRSVLTQANEGNPDDDFTASASGATVLDQSTQPVSWNNSWSLKNPTPGAGFVIFGGGIQNHFGQVGLTEVLVDVQRMTPSTPSTYVTTVGVNSGGQIRLFTSSPSSPFTTWIDSFNPPLANPADRVETADPDNDGANNLEEFAFGGNPANGSDSGTGQVLTVDANGDTLKDITLTLRVRSGATFSVSGNDLVSAPVDELTYRIEGSTDLATWDSAVSEVIPSLGAGSPGTGYVFKTFRLNAGNGLPGKGFLRASVSK
jgi:hypothetical protein